MAIAPKQMQQPIYILIYVSFLKVKVTFSETLYDWLQQRIEFCLPYSYCNKETIFIDRS